MVTGKIMLTSPTIKNKRA